jgi:hypothetical protein
VNVVLVGAEHTVFERAMEAARQELGRNARRGQCLQRVCEAYLAKQEGQVQGRCQGNDRAVCE